MGKKNEFRIVICCCVCFSDADMESDDDTEEEELHPLTEAELRDRVLKTVDRRQAKLLGAAAARRKATLTPQQAAAQFASHMGISVGNVSRSPSRAGSQMVMH